MKKIALVVSPEERPKGRRRLGTWEKFFYGWIGLRLKVSAFRPDCIYSPAGTKSRAAAKMILRLLRQEDAPLVPFNELKSICGADILKQPIPSHVQRQFNVVLLLHDEKPAVAAEVIFNYELFKSFYRQFLEEPVFWQKEILVMLSPGLLKPAAAVIEDRDPLLLEKEELSKGLPVIYSFDANGRLIKQEIGERCKYYGAKKAGVDIELY